VIDPGAPLWTELLFKLAAQAGGKRGAAAAGGDGDLQRAAADNGGIDEVAVLRIVNRVAEDAARGAGTKDSGIGLARAGSCDSEKSAVEIASGKGVATPNEHAGACVTLYGWKGPGADNRDGGAAGEEAVDLCGGHLAGTDDDAFSAGKVHQHGEEDTVGENSGGVHCSFWHLNSNSHMKQMLLVIPITAS